MPSAEPSSAVKARRPGKTPFEISVDENSRPPVLTLRGDVDIAVAQKLHEQLELLLVKGDTNLTINCTGVTYFDSTGLSELVLAARSLPEQGRIRLTGCSPRLMKLLNVTGLDNVFDLELANAA